MAQITQVATETALSIPEILSLIFSELPHGTQAACACVCKTWSELALDELWRNLEDHEPLLRLVIDDDAFYNEEFEMDDQLPFCVFTTDSEPALHPTSEK
ncbi:hypothetical protein FRC04_001151 [Tulasnella sp. 424]|nr:hypothetical protein FRC04_001151 [Tulasnella sp. 424]